MAGGGVVRQGSGGGREGGEWMTHECYGNMVALRWGGGLAAACTHGMEGADIGMRC